MKPQPDGFWGMQPPSHAPFVGIVRPDHGGVKDHCWNCPYGQSGDRLWVRETGWERPWRTPRQMREGADTWAPYYYDADGLTDDDHAQFKAWEFKRRPSIFMPRRFSRITLEVVSVRVERLQEISYEDAVAEGCGIAEDRFDPVGHGETWEQTARRLRWPQRSYQLLWNKINGRCAWEKNPWTWVIEFKQISKGDQHGKPA